MKLTFLALPFLLIISTSPHTASAGETVRISTLDLSSVIQGWGKPQADKAVSGKPLSIGGKLFEYGLGTHADSLVRLALKSGSERFLASVGAGYDSLCKILVNAPTSSWSFSRHEPSFRKIRSAAARYGIR